MFGSNKSTKTNKNGVALLAFEVSMIRHFVDGDGRTNDLLVGLIPGGLGNIVRVSVTVWVSKVLWLG